MSTTHYASTLAAEIIARALARQSDEPAIGPIGEFETVPECKVIRSDGTAEVVKGRKRMEVDWHRHMEFDRSKAVRPPMKPRPPVVFKPAPKRKARKPRKPAGKAAKFDPLAVLAMRATGIDYGQIAQRMGVSRSHVNNKLSEARHTSQEFRDAEAKLCTCPQCNGVKAVDRRLCHECLLKNSRTGQRGGMNKRQDITVEMIFAEWAAGKSTLQIASDHQCNPKTVHYHVADARKADPAIDALYRKVRACKCGRGKMAHSPVCVKCQKRSPRKTRVAGVESPPVASKASETRKGAAQ